MLEAAGQLLNSGCCCDLRWRHLQSSHFLEEESWERWEGLERTQGNEEDFSGRAQRIGKAEDRGGKSAHRKMQSERGGDIWENIEGEEDQALSWEVWGQAGKAVKGKGKAPWVWGSSS